MGDNARRVAFMAHYNGDVCPHICIFLWHNVPFGHPVLCHASLAFYPCRNCCPQKWTTFWEHKNRKASCHTNDMQDS